MTLEEVQEKWPIGSEVTIVSEKPKEHLNIIGWDSGKDLILGKKVEVCGHSFSYATGVGGILSIEVPPNLIRSFDKYYIHPSWIEENFDSEEEDCASKLRDKYLSEIFS